jgi:hypothetical protein
MNDRVTVEHADIPIDDLVAEALEEPAGSVDPDVLPPRRKRSLVAIRRSNPEICLPLDRRFLKILHGPPPGGCLDPLVRLDGFADPPSAIATVPLNGRVPL